MYRQRGKLVARDGYVSASRGNVMQPPASQPALEFQTEPDPQFSFAGDFAIPPAARGKH
jgi:hypothetical protein